MNQIVTLTLDGRALGIDVASVQDVIKRGAVTAIPRSEPWIAGVMNLRGHIVTAIDVRERLGLPRSDDRTKQMCVVVQHGGEAFALIVDTVGEVIAVDEAQREPDPPTLEPQWRPVSLGVIRRDDDLILEISPGAIIRPEMAAAA